MTRYDWTQGVDRSAQDSMKWKLMRDAVPDLPEGIYPFSVADIDLPPAPEIVEGLREHLTGAVLGYPSVPAGYTASVIDWMHRRHGWDIRADWIVQTPGVVPALSTAVRAFTEPGDGVIVQVPAYHPFVDAVERNGRRLLADPLVLDGQTWRLDLDHLRALAADPSATMLIFCSPHNPTGRVWTREELAEVARIAEENDLVIISDEIHFDLIQPGVEHTVMSTLDEATAARTVVCTAPSKTFNLAGLFTSNIVISDPDLRDRFRAELAAQGLSMLNTLGYVACELAYTRGEEWLAELIELVGSNHAMVRDTLADALPEVRTFPLEGTYLQWIDFRGTGMDAEQLRILHQEQAHVFFDVGTKFGDVGSGFARLNLAAPTALIREALDRLVRVHRESGGQSADAVTA